MCQACHLRGHALCTWQGLIYHDELGMPQDTAAEGPDMVEPPEVQRQAEDGVPVDHTSDTSILGNIKKHLKVWVTLRRPITKVRRLLWRLVWLPSDHSKVVMSSLLILGEIGPSLPSSTRHAFARHPCGPPHRHVAQECENCGDRSMGLGQLSDDSSPGQDGMSHNTMFDSDEPSVHSSAPAASV